jgi:hypothetical protein
MTFHPGDFRGVYVATFSGNFHTSVVDASGVPFFGFLYLDADGSGGVTGFWEIAVPAGGTYGDLNPLHSTYTVTPQGRVHFNLQSTVGGSILSVTVFLADRNRSILGFGGFTLGGGGGGGVGSVRGTKQKKR